MKVKTMINRFMFSQVNFDSGSLCVLASVVHKFPEAGKYHGAILRGADVVGRFSIVVGEQPTPTATSPAEQQSVRIDLRQLDLPVSKHLESQTCNCFVLKPGGYAVFYVSTGAGGYAVEIRKTGKECGGAKVFDSRELKEEDMFTATVIRPGTYSIANVSTKAKGELVVAYQEIGKIPRQPEAVAIECTENALTPNKIRINPTQTLVFRFKTPSRIKIELIKPEDRPRPSAPATHSEQTAAQSKAPPAKKVMRRLRISP